MVLPGLGFHQKFFISSMIFLVCCSSFSQTFSRKIGKKYFEEKDYLGDIVAVFRDTKSPVNPNELTLGYNEQIAGFGMEQAGRTYQSQEYPFGFNGKEKVDEVTGEGNSYDFGERFYDARNARFFSIDRLQKKFPNKSPYLFAANNPILFIDREGLEEQVPWCGHGVTQGCVAESEISILKRWENRVIGATVMTELYLFPPTRPFATKIGIALGVAGLATLPSHDDDNAPLGIAGAVAILPTLPPPAAFANFESGAGPGLFMIFGRPPKPPPPALEPLEGILSRTRALGEQKAALRAQAEAKAAADKAALIAEGERAALQEGDFSKLYDPYFDPQKRLVDANAAKAARTPEQAAAAAQKLAEANSRAAEIRRLNEINKKAYDDHISKAPRLKPARDTKVGSFKIGVDIPDFAAIEAQQARELQILNDKINQALGTKDLPLVIPKKKE